MNFGDYLHDKRILSIDVFEANYDKIIRYIESESNGVLAYQVLGALILQTGSGLRENIRKRILDSINWDQEKSFWPTCLQGERQYCLDELRYQIMHHKRGSIYILLGIIFP